MDPSIISILSLALSFQFFARSLETLTNDVDLEGPRVSCDDPEQPYGMGEKLVESMRQVSEFIESDEN